jgi:hypothetical protein
MQLSLIDEFYLPFGGKLSPNNRWVTLSEMIPWSEFEDDYAENFRPTNKGEKAFPIGVALGALIIQTKLKLVDADVPQMIMENPYLQFFLGFKGFDGQKPPFHSSMMTHFRKRFTPEIMMEINETIVKAELAKQQEEKQDDTPDDQGGAGGGHTIDEIETRQIDPDDVDHRGKLILDATCAPSDIKYPTDLHLLNKAREILEGLIDQLHVPDIGTKEKPRVYRNQARKAYLQVEKLRKKPKKKLRKALGKQLGYVGRDLVYVHRYLENPERASLLNAKQQRQLETIEKLYEQQKYMYDTRTHSVSDRITSIQQPHVRPIVRGKAGATVEVGCKVTTSVVKGFTLFEELNFNNYNEGLLLQDAVRNYYHRFGCLPEAVLADSIFRNRENRKWLKDLGIRISGPRLGRPPKHVDPDDKRIAKEDSGERNAVEGTYGVTKRRYGLNLLKTKLEDTTKTSIILQFMVMNLDIGLRFFLSFFPKRLRWPKYLYFLRCITRFKSDFAFR